nr:hypothetical protein [uncultured Oscillibacter sp.]
MNWLKAHWKIPAAALALLIVWGLWYARPVDIYTLAPEVRSPEGITVDDNDLSRGVGQEPRLCSRGFTPEDPEWETVLAEIEALRFRRPPWNLVLQFVPQNTVTGRITHDGDWHILLYVGRRGARSIRIQFFIDEWDYLSPHSNRNLTLWVKDSKQTGDALAEVLRPLLGET